MQKLLIILLVSFLSIVLSMSCKKENPDSFSTASSIYFENLGDFNTYFDSSTITFAYGSDLLSDSVIRIRVKASGSPSDKTREFKVVADPSSTALAGVHYQSLPSTFEFAANSVDDTIEIKLLRSEDLKDLPVELILLLVPTDDFATDLQYQGTNDAGVPMSYIKYKISFSDILVQPEAWNPNYGKFTKNKLDILMELGNVNATWFISGDQITVFPSFAYNVKVNYLIVLLNNYLSANQNAGTPVLYEDGTLMRTDDYYD